MPWAALLIQVETGQLIFAVRSVLLSERVVMATLCDLLYRLQNSMNRGTYYRRMRSMGVVFGI
jgi:hypothetical protein